MLPYGDNRAAAEREHERFKARLKEERFGKNRSEDSTHTVKCPAGDATFILEKVEGVRIVDQAEFQRITRPQQKLKRELVIEDRLRLKEAGVLGKRTKG
jgi:hypothetical protein